jgi:hypothetical protein
MNSCIKTEGWLLGKQKQLETQKKQYDARIAKYELNPKLCKHCISPLSYKDKQRGKSFCSSTCSAVYNNTLRGEKNVKVVLCVCGKEFKTKSYITKKYCNSKCVGRHNTKKTLDILTPLFLLGNLTNRGSIKRVMLAMGVEHKCQICGIKDWQGKPIPMILDHINGRADNNMPGNLRFICSNCDSQTEHYKGKNKGNGRKSLGLL